MYPCVGMCMWVSVSSDQSCQIFLELRLLPNVGDGNHAGPLEEQYILLTNEQFL